MDKEGPTQKLFSKIANVVNFPELSDLCLTDIKFYTSDLHVCFECLSSYQSQFERSRPCELRAFQAFRTSPRDVLHGTSERELGGWTEEQDLMGLWARGSTRSEKERIHCVSLSVKFLSVRYAMRSGANSVFSITRDQLRSCPINIA
jgi:hypothetical protein